jgi:two-component system catabolic regulation response regulator CreB
MVDKQKILIIEDESSIADNIVYSLKSEGYDSVTVALGKDGILLSQEGSFDLIILDVGLPDTSGFEVCKAIRKHSNIPVIFLTARSDEIDRVVGLEIGADDYVIKPFSPRELVARVKAILRRIIVPSVLKDQSLLSIDSGKRQANFSGTSIDLTRFEFGILALLMKYPSQIYSREQLMQNVWPSPEESYDRAVDTHIKTLRSKLKSIAPDTDHIVTHRGLGYSFKGNG